MILVTWATRWHDGDDDDDLPRIRARMARRPSDPMREGPRFRGKHITDSLGFKTPFRTSHGWPFSPEWLLAFDYWLSGGHEKNTNNLSTPPPPTPPSLLSAL